MSRVPVEKRRYKPSYSISVRLGLDTIARRVEPRDQFERQAIRWIAEMRRWHMTRVQPPAHARYVKCKKSRKAA
jgi:hypothetical protein